MAASYDTVHESPWRLGWHHLQLSAPEGGEAAARAFWVDILGFVELTKPPALAARGGLWVRADGLEIHIGIEPGFTPPAKAHPGIVVGDLDGLAARLTSGGVVVTWDDAFPGMRRFYAFDPFGNRLEFLQPIEGEAATW